MKEIDAIDGLAVELHGTAEQAEAYTFRSMREHVEEVSALMSAGDAHWKAEAVDLIIHNYVLLRRHGVPGEEIDILLEKRTARFREKITDALHKKTAKRPGEKGYGKKDPGG